MNQSSPALWSPMVSGPEEDFTSFLEFGELQLNFPTFDTQSHDGGEAQHSPAHGMGSAMETEETMMGMKDNLQQQIDPSLMQMQTSMPGLQVLHGSADSLLDLNMQAQLFHQQQLQYHQQQRRMQGLYHRQGMIPPTPTSLEIHGQPRSYPQMDPQARAMYEHYTQKQQDSMVFTPLVSPAVTPHDNQFRMPEYTIPGEYFSPLTSPALEAQQGRPAQRSVYGAIRGSDTSDTASPIDMDVSQSLNFSAPSVPPLRKSKRRSTNTSTKSTGRAVKQSPAMKPQARKKQPSSTIISPKDIADVIEDAQRPKEAKNAQQGHSKVPTPYGQDSSEADSVSPEPLSEILMPPPATPRAESVGKSPYLSAQGNGSQSASAKQLRNAPATPASLMKIQKNAMSNAKNRQALEESSSTAEAELENIMEGIIADGAVTASPSKPVLPSLKTTDLNDDQTTPTISAKKATMSASTPASSAVLPSPQISSMASPGGSITSKRADPKTIGRGSKKRGSTSSSQVSPALRPKISPSIKPLLPEGTLLNAETSALLLASKSNYQNILEGTHLPGVSYPEALSTNLTSKRTSHKIAEQGRRNRINNALQEIASLLPSSTPTMNGMSGGANGNVGSPGFGQGTAAQQSNSKASTVEMAIEYIKSLQSELKDVKGRLQDAEKKLEGGSSTVVAAIKT